MQQTPRLATIYPDMDVLLDISFNSDQRGWAGLAVAMVAVGWLLFRSKYRKRDPLEKPNFGNLSQQRSVERQMQNLLVDLSDMARQMNAQIDTRAAKLEQLIKEADERIAALRRVDGAAPQKMPTEPVATSPPIEPAPSIQVPTLSFELDPRHAEIYSLADQGAGVSEIAKRVGQPTGEIELILALRPRAEQITS